MVFSKVMYVIGFFAVSYLCGRVFRIFEDADLADLNFFTRTLCRFLLLAAMPAYLTFGLLLDSIFDNRDKK